MENKSRIIILNAVLLSVIFGIIFIAKYRWGWAIAYLIAIPTLLLLPRWLYKNGLDKKFNRTFLAEIELLVLLGVMLAVLGENFLYENIPGFDSLVHFVNGMLLTILIVSLNHKRWLDKKLSPFLTIVLAGLVPGIMGEIYEFSADNFFGTHLWGDAFKPLWTDTISDVIFQTGGSVLAVAALKIYFRQWLKRWGLNLTGSADAS